MFRLRWIIIILKRNFILFFIILTCIAILTTYFIKVLLRTDTIFIITEKPLVKPTVVSLQNYYNNAEYRKKIAERKIKKLSQLVKKSRNIPFVLNSTLLKPSYNVHIFYYAWYGNIKQDNNFIHWNHDYIPNWKQDDKKLYPRGNHKAPYDIASNFYPALDCYSSRDPYVIHTHMKQIKDSGIGVVAVSWAPPGTKDSPDDILPLLFHYANKNNLKITMHIEPYPNRNPINLRKYLKSFFKMYSDHPALYKIRKTSTSELLPLIYVYDSYLTSIVMWKELLGRKGNISIRGTKMDAIFIGLLVDIHHRYHIKKSQFDGFYTYFASNGFSYGSSWKNWNNLSKFARQNELIFIPSVGPGYIDTQVRPWNTGNVRHRRHGQYYDVAWRSAISSGVKFISITSYNEWHEGTQIEPAKTYKTQEFTYTNYEPEGPDFYLNLTRWWIYQFNKH